MKARGGEPVWPGVPQGRGVVEARKIEGSGLLRRARTSRGSGLSTERKGVILAHPIRAADQGVLSVALATGRTGSSRRGGSLGPALGNRVMSRPKVGVQPDPDGFIVWRGREAAERFRVGGDSLRRDFR